MDEQYLTLTVLIAISSALIALELKFQGATLYAGKMIGIPGLDYDMPNGFQDAITPRWKSALTFLSLLIFLPITIIYGWLINWWLGILIILVILFLQRLISNLLPQRLSWYIMHLCNDMARRVANYKKNNDTTRANVAEEMLEKLQDFYLIVNDSGEPVPEIDIIKKMPVGGHWIQREAIKKRLMEIKPQKPIKSHKKMSKNKTH